MRKLVAVTLVLVLAAACSGGKKANNTATSAPATSAPLTSAPPRSPRPAVSEGNVNRPLKGIYVYTLTSVKGPALPSGLERIETLTWSGDNATSIIGTNKYSSQVTYERKWSSDGVRLLSSDSGQRKCPFNPPLQQIPLPLKVEALPRQNYSDVNLSCSGSTEITVFGKATTMDARGKKWSVWKIQEKATANGGESTQLHWFSPELGVDIRDESQTTAQANVTQTLSVLRDYP